MREDSEGSISGGEMPRSELGPAELIARDTVSVWTAVRVGTRYVR